MTDVPVATERTVSVHLGAVYVSLEVAGRSGLVALLAPQGCSQSRAVV